jgi:hypothetical protein
MPHDWTNWRYEAVLAVDDPSVQGAERPTDMPTEPIFDMNTHSPAQLNEAWRCAKCYATRFQTMCFGMNDAGTGGDSADPLGIKCSNCGGLRSDCGWSLW